MSAALSTARFGIARLYPASGARTTSRSAISSGTSAAGVKAKGAIVWTGTGAAPGVAASFRFKDSGAAACHIQGTVVTEQLGGAWMRAALWARAIRARNVREEEELAVI